MHTYANLSEMSVDDMRFHVDKYNKSHRKNPVKFTVRKIADDKYFAAVDGSAEAEFDKVPVAKNVPPDFKMLDSGKYRVIGRSFRDIRHFMTVFAHVAAQNETVMSSIMLLNRESLIRRKMMFIPLVHPV